MKLIVDEIPLEKKNNILVRLQLEEDDLTFIITRNDISFSIDEKTADSLSFHLNTIIEDREHRKESQKKAGKTE